jgi:Uma2 family endonuclease
MQINLSQLIIPSGQHVLLQDVNWESFEKILTELGDERSSPKISYHKGYLQLMAPLAIHEFDKSIIGDLVKILLESLDLEFSALGSTTLKSEQVHKGVEPDECFYIQHELKVRGKERIDLNQDPPPDLVLEIDITSQTELTIYEKLNVPELWRFDGKELQIFILQNQHYQNAEKSLQFPQFAIKQLIPEYLEKAKIEGRNKAIKAFRQFVTRSISPTG